MQLVSQLVILVSLALPNTLTNGVTAAEAEPACAPQGDIHFICTRFVPEDFARIPGTDWVVSAAYSGALGLRLLSIKDEKEIDILYPSIKANRQQDLAIYGACPGPLSAAGEATFVSHGLALRAAKDQSYTLYVVQHGERESIEVFKLNVVDENRPVVTWIGCVIAPARVLLNSVATLPEGGFVATHFWEREEDWKVPAMPAFREVFGDPLGATITMEKREQLRKQENTGYVLEWHPSSGWAKLPGSDAPGPNGIETSKDGKYVYVAMSGNTRLYRLSRGDNPPRRDEVDLGMTGLDNVKWATLGDQLLVAGNTGGKGRIVAVDPDTLQVTDLLKSPGPATTGYQVDNDIWIGSSRALRVTIMPLPKEWY